MLKHIYHSATALNAILGYAIKIVAKWPMDIAMIQAIENRKGEKQIEYYKCVRNYANQKLQIAS